jgi:hypothetical protein
MTDPLALRVARLFLARTVPIDKPAIKRLAESLAEGLKKELGKMSPDEPVGDDILVPETFRLRKVVGGEILIRVTLMTEPSPSGNLVTDSVYTINERGNLLGVTVNGRGSVKAMLLAIRTGMLAGEVYTALLHELTHAADKIHGVQDEEAMRSDPRLYYNQPGEVRAYTQEIVEQALEAARQLVKNPAKRTPKLAQTALMVSETWGKIKKYLSPQNAQKIMKTVYQVLDREGLLSPEV